MNAASKAGTDMASELVHHRFALEQYEKMVEDGILTSDDRVELLDGEIVEKMPIGPRHAACVRKMQARFFEVFRDVAIASVHSPVGLPPRSEAEPDLALLQPKDDNYASLHPRPDDVLLVVEVADSTLRRDRAKLHIHAAAGIPEVWIVDVDRNVVEAYSQPERERYRAVRTLGPEETLTPLAFPNVDFSVGEILP